MSISISARIRPLLEEEREKDEKLVWKVITHLLPSQVDNQKNVIFFEHSDDPKKHRREFLKEFTFNDVFDETQSNQEIYQKLVKDLVDMAVAGLNASFFVYGQTGSGKTFTISGTKYEEGVFQLAIKDILERQKNMKFKIMISTFEIYKEQIFDLLSKDDEYREPLKIKEKKEEGRFEIDSLSTHQILCWNDFRSIIYKAESRRHFANTYLKHNSSRSHFGVQIKLIMGESQKAGQLMFFDLAGCEKFEAYKDNVEKNFGESCSPVRLTK